MWCAGRRNGPGHPAGPITGASPLPKADHVKAAQMAVPYADA